MSHSLSIVMREDQPVLSIQTRTSMNDLPETIHQALMKVGHYLDQMGVQPSGPAFVAYFNLDIRDSSVEIGFPVTDLLTGRGEVQARTIPGGPAGVCHYTGPYQDLATVYQQLNSYIEGQGREPTGVSYEFYLNDPAVTPSDELQTQIIFPLVGEKERSVGIGRVHTLFW